MDEYISKHDVLVALMDNDLDHIQAPNGKEAVQIFSELPPADVVPVIRCRDCKHLDVKMAIGWGICKDANGCGRLCGPNDFCSSGVRKEREA